MKKYFSKWSVMRYLRFILGIVIVIQSILEKDWLIFSIGTLLSFSAVINFSYCSMGACDVPVNSGKKSDSSYKTK